MQTEKISYKRHRFPPQIIAHFVWLYARFNLSLREVGELMLERGVDVSYEPIRRWGFVPKRIITDKLRSYGAATAKNDRELDAAALALV